METAQITFLGTGATRPSRWRNCSGTLLNFNGVCTLVDCGDGVQGQLVRSGTGPAALHSVIITHLHTDHYLGLAGLIGSAHLDGASLNIYTLEENITALEKYLDACAVPRRAYSLSPLPQRLQLTADWNIVYARANHTVPSIHLRFQERDQPRRLLVDLVPEGIKGRALGALARGEKLVLEDGTELDGNDYLGPERKGRSIVLSGDTAPHRGLIDFAKEATLLVHEATFTHDERDRARETKHSTARQAGQNAERSLAQELVLTHIGTRASTRGYLEDARKSYRGKITVPRDGDGLILESV
jgi:ribonuclease Z